MKRTAALGLSILFLFSVSAVGQGTALTNADVIKLVKLALGDDVVVAKIRQAPSVDFKLETDDLVKLKSEGVSSKVITGMLDRSSGAAVGGIVTPESVHGLAGGPPGDGGQNRPTLEGKDGRKPLVVHMGEGHTVGFMGIGNAFLVYPGAKCAIRTTDKRPVLIIHSDIAPEEQILLAKLEADPKDNDRSLKLGRMLGNPFSDKKSAKPDADWTVAYDATEGPAGVWRIIPKSDLAAGEYGLYFSNFGLFDFGVD